MGVGRGTIAGMIEERWIEEGHSGSGIRTFNITDEGLEALKRRLPD